jgi:hypothetical protein
VSGGEKSLIIYIKNSIDPFSKYETMIGEKMENPC